MTKEYLGVNAVNDLFDIIDENYVSKEDLKNKETAIASAACVGSALIAQCLLKIAEAIMVSKGAEGGEIMSDTLIASASEVSEVLNKYFKGNVYVPSDDESDVDENHVATDEETNEVIHKYFK